MRFPVFAFGGLLALTLAGDWRVHAHEVLDAEIVRPILSDIARDLRQSREAASDTARLEALFQAGERAHQLVEIMNLDLLAHGRSLLGELLTGRLAEHGIRIGFIEGNSRYAADLAPFEEYLRRAPAGPRAADAKFRVISERFHRSAGRSLEEIPAGGLHELHDTVARHEAFLRDHPGHAQVKEVRFFLAMDYYRLFRNGAGTTKRYEPLARRALLQVVHDAPKSAEARSAEIALKALEDERSAAEKRPAP